ncbi:AraC family transcriptional regulator [Alcanivorax sp. JB21]|uniref:AraC family transcriptional regulator n=1 Tax=Alcanivorax limicola TaxID=2874102 RepID=UPI001CC0BE56|nr:AraC family transcriptional regulator [Alcanivorax limicola]MBZ2188433.1 AraC family transcriptional regulator [Alcanivorax limicola]
MNEHASEPAAGVLLGEYAEMLCQFMGQAHPVSALLAGTGLSRDLFSEPGYRLSMTATRRLLRNARQLDPAPDLGMRLGQPLNFGSHGFLGYAAISSSTLGQAFELAVRYIRTRAGLFDIQMLQDGDMTVVRFDARHALDDLLPLVCDALVTSILSIGEQMFRVIPAHRVHLLLPYGEAPHHQRWREHSDFQLHFGQLHLGASALVIRFPAQWMAAPLDTADPQLAMLAAARCEEELRLAGGADDVIIQVRQLARRFLREDNAQQCVADAMHISVRTLRRHLARANTTYKALSDVLRHELAVDLLRDRTRSVEDIASELGYSDPSNFGRAFRRWAGMSPRQFRQQ